MPQEHGIRIGQDELRRLLAQTRNNRIDLREPARFVDPKANRPGTEIEKELIIGLDELQRSFVGEFLGPEHFAGWDQQIVWPGERESGLLQDVPTIGGVDLAAFATQLEAAKSLPR